MNNDDEYFKCFLYGIGFEDMEKRWELIWWGKLELLKVDYKRLLVGIKVLGGEKKILIY